MLGFINPIILPTEDQINTFLLVYATIEFLIVTALTRLCFFIGNLMTCFVEKMNVGTYAEHYRHHNFLNVSVDGVAFRMEGQSICRFYM
jgi:hypothetical protein